ncbi:hypothetical protein GCM10009837_70960 [Streptomyces durmitorensis]|uniref:Integral membrane protein n=1 Tax=Streptomyces durmitorensis TaxID=319947 RepID=A0ABY4PVF1_9ACTN|nr:hypothetical protein [Streptomyces durmitorensis]UQT57395.1 hypothetical protein M4V62_21075 [Streptomyces durmitorensis]
MAHVASTSTAPRLLGGSAASRAASTAALLAVVYGIWAAGIARDAGPITTGNVLLGVVAGVVVGAVFMGLRRAAPRLPRELRAAAWAGFAGVAFGYLYSLTDATILRSVIMSLAVAGGVFALMFYRYYTSE